MCPGRLERFLLDHGETVVRLPPRLMAGARESVRERGKSEPIDVPAVARAALREGLESLAVARLAGPELDIRQLVVHRERLVDARTRLINELRWQLHDLWPEWEIPKRALTGVGWQAKIARRLQRTESTARVRMARDEIRRIRDLTRRINAMHQELAPLVAQVAPQLLAERCVGVLIAAKLIGEIAGINRFATDSKLARMAGCAPIPASSGRTTRHRLDRGGNRQLNHAIHMLAITKIIHDPQTAVLSRQTTRPRQNQPRSDPLPQTPPHPTDLQPFTRTHPSPNHTLLDIGDSAEACSTQKPDYQPYPHGPGRTRTCARRIMRRTFPLHLRCFWGSERF